MTDINAQKDIARIKATLKRAQDYAWERRYGGLRPLWEDCTMSLQAVEQIRERVEGASCQEAEK